MTQEEIDAQNRYIASLPDFSEITEEVERDCYQNQVPAPDE